MEETTRITPKASAFFSGQAHRQDRSMLGVLDMNEVTGLEQALHQGPGRRDRKSSEPISKR